MRTKFLVALALVATATNVICAVISCRNSVRLGGTPTLKQTVSPISAISSLKAQQDICSQALELSIENMQAKEWQHAYDALLAAMRIAPGDEQVFDASLGFIRTAVNSNNDEALSLAQDVYQRAANVIPFLPLKRLKDARDSYTQIGENLFPSMKTASPDKPLSEAKDLLKSASGPGLPTFARTRLLQEVEAELGGQARRIASLPLSKEKDAEWKVWSEIKQSLDEAQKELLRIVYQEDCKARIVSWRKKEADFTQQKFNASLDDVHRVNDEIVSLILEGQRVSRDLVPFLEGGVDAAVADSHDESLNLDKRLMALAQLREWNYNRWALDRVDKVEQSGGTNFERLKSLTVIDESRLAPYIGQRLGEGWKRLFDECSNGDKVEATKLRILREYKQ